MSFELRNEKLENLEEDEEVNCYTKQHGSSDDPPDLQVPICGPAPCVLQVCTGKTPGNNKQHGEGPTHHQVLGPQPPFRKHCRLQQSVEVKSFNQQPQVIGAHKVVQEDLDGATGDGYLWQI